MIFGLPNRGLLCDLCNPAKQSRPAMASSEAKVPSSLSQRSSVLAVVHPCTRRKGAIHTHFYSKEKMYSLNILSPCLVDSSGTSVATLSPLSLSNVAWMQCYRVEGAVAWESCPDVSPISASTLAPLCLMFFLCIK